MASIEAEIGRLDLIEFWLIAAVLIGFSVWALCKTYLSYMAARTIETIPTAKIRSAAQGYVELIGETKMMKGPVIVSPLTGKTCVWYRYIIEEKVTEYTTKGTRTSWRIVKEHTSDDLFVLQDDTGQCVIDPEEADVITEHKSKWHNNNVIPKRRYTEWLIKEDHRLYAIGFFESIAHVEREKIRNQVSHLLREWKQDDPNKLVHLYDKNGDGQVDVTEWQQARADAESHVRKQNQEFGELSVLSNSAHANQQFILSTLPESSLVNRYKKHAALALIGFLASGSIVVWALNIRLGMN